MPSNEVLAPSHRSNHQHVRQGNDYQHVTVGEGSRAILGNVYADNFSMNILDQSQCPDPEKKEQEKKNAFLKSLRFDAMDSRLATIGIAHRGTCSWLYTREEYLRWQDPGLRTSHHGFLWIKGKPGAGKSTMMKHALHHAQSLDQRDTTILSFFFNARGRELEKTTEGMYRSLLHQVYTAFPERLPGALPSYPLDSDNSWQLPILQSMLRDALLNFGNSAAIICYIDALDECEEDAIRLAIEYFEELGELAVSQNTKISICFASRHYPNITMQRYQGLDLDEQEDHHEDIQKFVTGKLRGTGRTHSELSVAISRRSSGVFLWAALVVQILNKKMDHGATRSQLMTDLKAVPVGIKDLLKSLLTDGSEFLLPALLWVLFSFRPLSAPALYLAIRIGAGRLTPEDLDQTETTQEQMQLFILQSSKGLVEFSKGDHATAQFIHESVREHLLNGGLSVLDDSPAENLEAGSHARLAAWCQNCIELDPPRGLRDSDTSGGNLMRYALHHLYRHCEHAYDGGALQLEFLDAIPQSTQSFIGSRVYRSGNECLLSFLLEHRQECAHLAEGLLRRQLRLSDQVDAFATACNDAIEGTIPCLDVNSCGSSDGHTTTPLLSALYLGYRGSDTIVRLLLDCGADPDLESWRHAPLLVALEHRKDDIVELMLHRGASVNLVRTHRNRATTPLAMALRWSSTKCVNILLECGANPNLVSPEGPPLLIALRNGYCDAFDSVVLNIARKYSGVTRTPIAIAKRQRSTRFVELLLEHGANPNCGSSDDTPLIAALRNEDCDTVELLLHHGASPNTTITHREMTQIPLAMAISQRSTRCVKALLEHGADANGCRVELGKFLTDAIETDQQEVVRMLLERGADANGCSAKREIPLTAAIRKGQQEAVTMLLQHGANADGGSAEFGRPLTNAVSRQPCIEEIILLLLAHGAGPEGSSNHRPLHAAISTRNEAVTRSLLEAGVDVRVRDGMGRSCLHVLCLECPSEDRPWKMNTMAEILLDAGLDINATDESHKTALVLALEMGHFSLLLLLIRRGADVNTNDAANGTPLMMAARMGALSVVQILLDAGADIDAIDTTRRTALTMAVEKGNFDLARLLVDRGANLSMHGHEGVVRYLRLRMAEEDAVADLDGCDRMSE
jgi:ankyrin repeat protein